MQACITQVLSNLFDESFSHDISPEHMKLAIVMPVYNIKESSNNRFVTIGQSILPILSKVLEKLILNRLTEFLGKSKITYKHQFGFQKNKFPRQPCLQCFP